MVDGPRLECCVVFRRGCEEGPTEPSSVQTTTSSNTSQGHSVYFLASHTKADSLAHTGC